jgi:hypothetical protein
VTRLGDFLLIGLLLESHCDLKKDEVAQINGNILGYFLIKQIYYILSNFKTWFVAGILRFQKWFVVDDLDSEIRLCCRYFGIFGIGNCLVYFLKQWTIFFQNLWSP